MERKTYQAGESIFVNGELVDRLTVIQSGVVELSVPYDKRLRDELFVIERLIPGAILNHQAFIVKDHASADYVCRTPVSCFELSYERMKKVMNKRADLQQARKDVKKALFTPQYQVALDYIFHNDSESQEEYDQKLATNDFKVKFKNAVMQVWTQIKRQRQPKDMSTMIQEMQEKKRKAMAKLGLMQGGKNDNRQDDENEKLELESKTSIFTLE